MTVPRTYSGRVPVVGKGCVVVESICKEDPPKDEITNFCDASVTTLSNSYPVRLFFLDIL